MSDPASKYGTKVGQIDPFFREKFAWSKVKDKIVGDYVACYLKTVHARGRPIIIVDAFSGPGRFGDGFDGSPLIICNAIDKAPRRGVGIACLFADVNATHRAALEQALASFIGKGIAGKPLASFDDALSHALKAGQGSTLFFYLDPYGIKDLEFDTVRQIYERDLSESTEVLINFSFKTFMRMSGNWSYSDTAAVVAQRVKESKVETVNRVMGGDYWIDIVTDQKLSKIEREDAIVAAYVDRVRRFFRYTFSIPVKEIEEGSNIPVDELAKYHLIFGTRNLKAVIYMNDVALNALEPYFDQFKDGLLFSVLPSRYEPPAKEKIKAQILTAVSARSLKRPQVYEAVIPSNFLSYRTKDYRAMIDELTFAEGKLFPDPRTVKRPRQLNDDTLLSTKPWTAGA